MGISSTSWQKGQSGNPKGRPRSKREILAEAIIRKYRESHGEKILNSLSEILEARSLDREDRELMNFKLKAASLLISLVFPNRKEIIQNLKSLTKTDVFQSSRLEEGDLS